MPDTTAWIARHRMHALRLWASALSTPEAVVAQLTALQAQEHAYARWSVAQRTAPTSGASAVDTAFDEGRILRTHVLRPTWHFVTADNLRWLVDMSGPLVESRNARRYNELGLDPATRTRSAAVIADAVAGGPCTRRGLGEILERHGISVAGQRLPYLLMHSELTAVICSGPMRGKQHTYAAFDDRVPLVKGPSREEALAELARRYFTTRGPATTPDLAWWAGLSADDARRGLALVRSELSSREVDGRTYWFADLGETTPISLRVDLVQCYDEAIISYRQSRDVLQTPSAAFAVPGHIDGFTHVLLLDGRLLGHWRASHARGGLKVETRAATLNGAKRAALADAIDRYRAFSGDEA
jgi:Winged helix DNA-binding domain